MSSSISAVTYETGVVTELFIVLMPGDSRECEVSGRRSPAKLLALFLEVDALHPLFLLGLACARAGVSLFVSLRGRTIAAWSLFLHDSSCVQVTPPPEGRDANLRVVLQLAVPYRV